MLRYCFQLLEPVNYSEKVPVATIAGRNIYRCSYVKKDRYTKKSLDITRMYFIQCNNDAEKGAYLLFHFDIDKADLVYIDFMRKPGEDLEALRYVILQFLSVLGYKVENYKLSPNGNSFYKI